MLNPTAGGGRGRSAGAALEAALADAGHVVIHLSSHTSSEALAKARSAVAQGLDALVVVGGDGVVHLGVQAVARTTVAMGVVPIGTGNDFARAVGLPHRIDHAIDRVLQGLEGQSSPVDLLRVSGDGVEGNPRWVATAVCAGLDASVTARANAMRRPRGSARYPLAALVEIARYRSWGYRVQVRNSADEIVLDWRSRGALVTVANGPTFGGGIRVAPRARLDDGELDVILARDIGRLTAARLFPALLTGRHLRSRHLTAAVGCEVRIDGCEGPRIGPPVYGDGEWIGSLPVRVEVVPGALALLGGRFT